MNNQLGMILLKLGFNCSSENFLIKHFLNDFWTIFKLWRSAILLFHPSAITIKQHDEIRQRQNPRFHQATFYRTRYAPYSYGTKIYRYVPGEDYEIGGSSNLHWPVLQLRLETHWRRLTGPATGSGEQAVNLRHLWREPRRVPGAFWVFGPRPPRLQRWVSGHGYERPEVYLQELFWVSTEGQNTGGVFEEDEESKGSYEKNGTDENCGEEMYCIVCR